jgi:hypothetical protein
MKCVFRFSARLFSAIFLILRIIERDFAINVLRSSCRVPIILATEIMSVLHTGREVEKIKCKEDRRKEVILVRIAVRVAQKRHLEPIRSFRRRGKSPATTGY